MASTSHVSPYAYSMPGLAQHQNSPFKLPSIDSMATRAPPMPLTVHIPFNASAISAQSDPIAVKTSPDSPAYGSSSPIDMMPHVAPIRLEATPPPVHMDHPPHKRRRQKSSPTSTPATSPGGTSLSSEHPTSMEGVTPPISPTDGLPAVPETEFLDCFSYCSECVKHAHVPEAYINHLVDCHLNPTRLPSHLFEELKHKYERAALKPYSTFYPSKKRKPNSGRIPRPQNQYMVSVPSLPFCHFAISRKFSF